MHRPFSVIPKWRIDSIFLGIRILGHSQNPICDEHDLQVQALYRGSKLVIPTFGGHISRPFKKMSAKKMEDKK